MQRVIVGDLEEGVGFNGTSLTRCGGGAPYIIDDIFICWQESSQFADGVLGLATIGTFRGDTQVNRLLPLISEVVLNGKILDGAEEPDSDGRKLLVVAIVRTGTDGVEAKKSHLTTTAFLYGSI